MHHQVVQERHMQHQVYREEVVYPGCTQGGVPGSGSPSCTPSWVHRPAARHHPCTEHRYGGVQEEYRARNNTLGSDSLPGPG